MEKKSYQGVEGRVSFNLASYNLQQPSSTLRLIKWQNSFSENEALKCSQPSRSNHIKQVKNKQPMSGMANQRSRKKKMNVCDFLEVCQSPSGCVSMKPHGDNWWFWVLIYLPGTADCFMNIINDSQGTEMILPLFQEAKRHGWALGILLQIIRHCQDKSSVRLYNVTA